MISGLKTFYHRSPWTGRFIITFFVFTLLLIGARIALSPGIIYGTTSWLKQQGIEANIETVDFDILDGTVLLKNAVGNKDGTPLFKIGLIELHWRWRPLSNKTIEITRIALDSLDIKIRQYHDALIIGGVHIPLGKMPDETLTASNDESTDKNVPTWAAALGEVNLGKLKICYLQHASTLAQSNDASRLIDYCIDLKKMSWVGTISYARDAALLKTDVLPLTSTGNFTLNGLSIIDMRLNKKLLSSKSNTLNTVTVRGLNDIHIDQLTMNGLSLLQRDDDKHIDSLRFHQLIINNIKFSDLNNLHINNISVSKPGIYLVKEKPDNWEYQQWIAATVTNKKTAGKTSTIKSVDKTSSFQLSLNDININDADLCYLNNNTSLYYCLTFSSLDWQGNFKYNATPLKSGAVNLLAEGGLELSQPNIHNHTIERNLLDFKKLKLTKLKFAGLDRVSIEKINLNQLGALQRSKKDADNTVSFKNLSIDDIRYIEGKIAINTIVLKGLAAAVSKNADGRWEHDKWRTETLSEKTGDTSEEPSPAKHKKPLAFAIDDLSITTDQQILFTDNSTQPAMKIGLSRLTFDAKHIDTDRPATDSPFKLSAKTTRHGTIDIEGSARPFARNISFDTSGKLKGFDLRAATPATKKAIGHIIQSGQLDADLKLLAVDGVLDSNISLSLYQFNIKAINKKSAKELDAKFGMPLNQTLVLLRDKDDSIHLDIPITGDVNNPNFDPMDAIIKATSKAATVALITFYTPYGLVYAGSNLAFNLATALNFDPVTFTPGSAEISDNSRQQLDNLTKLLTEKPQVHLTLCGVTNQQDVFVLYPALKEKAKKDKTEIILNEKQLSQLNQLARERQINSKNYLVTQYGIDHDRLILCAPEHKTGDDAIAGVEINI